MILHEVLHISLLILPHPHTQIPPMTAQHCCPGLRDHSSDEGELVFLSKGRIVFNGVKRHTVHKDALLLIVGEFITESASLLRSARSGSLGLKPEDRF